MWQNYIFELTYSKALIALIFMKPTKAAQRKVEICIKFHSNWPGNT